MFAKTGTQFFYYQFRNLRNKFKHVVRAKARSYMDSMRKKVEDSIGDQKKFWNQVKKLTLTGLSGSAVSAKTWFDYYKELLNPKPQSVDKEFDKHVTEFIEAHDANFILCQNNVSEGDPELEKLNSEVTEEEVKINIKKAKNGKTHGVDGILNKAIKAAESAILKILVRLCNILFNYSIFPTSWCVSIIVSWCRWYFKQSNQSSGERDFKDIGEVM